MWPFHRENKPTVDELNEKWRKTMLERMLELEERMLVLEFDTKEYKKRARSSLKSLKNEEDLNNSIFLPEWVVSLLSKLKNTFLPSASVAAARRKDVFGTESKAVAATAILGGAALAIAAPVAVGAAGGTRAVLGAVGRTAIANPVKTAAVGFVAAPAIAGVVSSEPKTVSRAAGSAINFQGNLYNVAKNPSVEGFKTLVSENPITSAAAGLLVGAAVGGGAVGAIGSALNTSAVRENTRATKKAAKEAFDALPSSTEPYIPAAAVGSPSGLEAPSAAAGSMVPLTPATQEVSSPRRRSVKKRAVAAAAVRNSIKIVNQNTFIGGQRRKTAWA